MMQTQPPPAFRFNLRDLLLGLSLCAFVFAMLRGFGIGFAFLASYISLVFLMLRIERSVSLGARIILFVFFLMLSGMLLAFVQLWGAR